MNEPDSTWQTGPAITGDDPEAACGPLGQRGQAKDADPGPVEQPPESQPEDWQDGLPGEPGGDEDDGYVPL